MEVLEIVLYLILTIILIALVGVLSWLTYDYFNYKNVEYYEQINREFTRYSFPEDYDKLTYPKLIRLAYEKAPTGEDLYEKIQGDMLTINPAF